LAKKAKTVGNNFIQKANNLNKCRIKYEYLVDRGQLSVDEVAQVYTGLFLNLFTEFECLISEMFYGLLRGTISSGHSRYKRLINITPKDKVINVIQDKNYIDWLPIQEKTLPLAKKYFYEGLPFTDLVDKNKGDLKFYQIIRNALAHKSEYSIKKFEDSINSLTLLPHEKNPAYFLRSIPNRNQAKTQFEIVKDELIVIAKIICQ